MNRRTMMITTALLAFSGLGAAAGIYVEQARTPGGASTDEQPTTGPVLAANRPSATLYRNPNCDCCLEYAKYLRSNGFDVTVDAKQDLSAIRKQLRVPQRLEGCHVMVIGQYAVEGHVPVKTLNKLLAEHPDIIGVSLPGMPTGTPGMTGPKRGPFTIYEIPRDSAPAKVFSVE